MMNIIYNSHARFSAKFYTLVQSLLDGIELDT